MMSTSEALGAYVAALFDPTDILEVRLLPLKQSTWFRAEKLCPQPTWSGQNVYVGANPRKATGLRDAAGVALARSLFVDIDNTTNEEAFARLEKSGVPRPTVIVRSGGGVHFYWRLAEPMTDLAAWSDRQRAMIALFSSDPAIHDPPRILRLPGTVNVKRGLECELIEADPARVYGLDQFPEAAPRQQSTAARVAAMGGFAQGVAGLSRHSLIYLVQGATEGNRNQALFSAACDYAGCGIPQAAADAALRTVAQRSGLDDEEITAALESAYGKARSPSRPPKATATPAKGAAGGEAGAAGTESGRGSPSPAPVAPEVEPVLLPRHGLTNVTDDYLEIQRRGADGKMRTKTEHVTYYKPIETICTEIIHAAGGWPKLVGSVPFTMTGEGLEAQANLMATPSALFAWLHQEMDVRWAVSGCQHRETKAPQTPPTKGELHEILKQGGGGIERYQMLTNYPHIPAMRGIYYTPLNLPAATGVRLAEFLAMLNPETEEDRQLMLAALLTPGWGGEPGTRPMFVLTSDAGVGAGKTATANALADIWGGACSLDYEESWADLSKAMMSSNDWTARCLLFDNVKGKFGGSALEAIVSAKTLSGWRAYVGKVSRPNDATIYVTFNMPQLTRDMAERAVVIKIGKPKHDKSFVAQTQAFIREHRLELLADLCDILRRPIQEAISPENGDRWQHWQREILGRIRGGDELAALICARRPEVDSDADDAMAVATMLLAATDGDEVDSHAIHREAAALGLWKDDPSKSNDRNIQNCISWVRRVLSGRGIISPKESAPGKQSKRRIRNENGEQVGWAGVFRLNRAAAESLTDSDEDGDAIPI